MMFDFALCSTGRPVLGSPINPIHLNCEHVYAICGRPEVADDVISHQNVKTIEGYVVVNFEVTSFISFRFLKKSFNDGSGGSRH